MAAGELPGGRPVEMVMIGQPGGSLIFGGYVPLEPKPGRPALRISPRAASEGMLILAGFPVLEAEGVLGHLDVQGRRLGRQAAGGDAQIGRAALPAVGVLDQGGAHSARQAIDRLEPWLLDPARAGRAAVILEGEGALVLTDIAPTGEWSAERLDRVGAQAVEATALLE